MIVGRGLLASAFEKYLLNENILVFASGVSNSRERDEAQFARETELLKEHIRTLKQDSKIVYFSSCSLFDPDLKSSRYVEHKHQMEELLSISNSNLIVRLPNIVGSGGNKNTLLNFLTEKVRLQQQFVVLTNDVRNILDIDDVVEIVTYLIEKNITGGINVASPFQYSIVEIVREIEKHYEVKARVNLIDRGSPFEIDTGEISKLKLFPKQLKKGSYLSNVLKKYYL